MSPEVDRLTVEQAAAEIGVCSKTLRQHEKEGLLRGYCIWAGGRLYFSKTKIAEMMAAGGYKKVKQRKA